MVLERDIRTQRDEKVRALQRTCLGECRVKLHDDAAALDAFTGAFGDDASLGVHFDRTSARRASRPSCSSALSTLVPQTP